VTWSPERLALVVITDPDAPAGLIGAAGAALRGGAPAIQLRGKTLPTSRLLEAAISLRKATRNAGALLIVNDRIDIAVAVGGDGAHLGDDDLPLEIARRLVPPGFLLGRSVDDAAEAKQAVAAGADYLGAGPVYPTTTKNDTGPVLGLDGLAAIRAAVDVPIVAIGGITAETLDAVLATGVDGVAAIGAVASRPDPAGAAAEFMSRIRALGDGPALRPGAADDV
jgi:thiamine-phosphate pyrophosphorylase